MEETKRLGDRLVRRNRAGIFAEIRTLVVPAEIFAGVTEWGLAWTKATTTIKLVSNR